MNRLVCHARRLPSISCVARSVLAGLLLSGLALCELGYAIEGQLAIASRPSLDLLVQAPSSINESGRLSIRPSVPGYLQIQRVAVAAQASAHAQHAVASSMGTQYRKAGLSCLSKPVLATKRVRVLCQYLYDAHTPAAETPEALDWQAQRSSL